MRKHILIFRGTKNESYETFKQSIISHSENILSDKNVLALTFTITLETPPRISIIPFKKKKIACLSVYSKTSIPLNQYMNLPGFSGIYQVEEAFPVAYKKTWENGIQTPGICLLTLFRQKKNIDYPTFIHRWHNSHTPLSLKTHPLWHYNRNVVLKQKLQDPEKWDGIVEEHMRTRSELLNPFKFFGNPLVMIPRMIQVYTDTKSFLDYKTIETYLAAEYHMK